MKIVVNSVTGGSGLKNVLWITGVLCGAGFLISYAKRLINRRAYSHETELKERLKQILAKKAASLDFEYIDNTQIQNDYHIALENLFSNNGLLNIRGNFSYAVISIIKIIISISMIIPSVLAYSGEDGIIGAAYGATAIIQIIRGGFRNEQRFSKDQCCARLLQEGMLVSDPGNHQGR